MQTNITCALTFALGFSLHAGIYQATSLFGYFQDSNYAVCLGILFCLNRIALRYKSKWRRAVMARVQIPFIVIVLAIVGYSHAQFLEGIKSYVPRVMFGKQDDLDYGIETAKMKFLSASSLNPTSNKYLRFSMMADLVSGSLAKLPARLYLFPLDGDLCLIIAWHKYLSGNNLAARQFWERGLMLGGNPQLFLEIGILGTPWAD